MGYSLVTRLEIWNDKTGEKLDIGEDGDGLGLVEIRSFADDGAKGPTIVLQEEALPLLIEALMLYKDRHK